MKGKGQLWLLFSWVRAKRKTMQGVIFVCFLSPIPPCNPGFQHIYVDGGGAGNRDWHVRMDELGEAGTSTHQSGEELGAPCLLP